MAIGTQYEAHEYANIFPLLQGQELFDLMDDIIDNGLVHPITLYKDKILDGRNRYEACSRIGKEPTYTIFEGTNEQALAHVISLNLKRRHLTASQSSMSAGRAKTMFEKAAKENMEATQAKPGEKVGSKAFPNLENPKEPIHANKKAAEMFNVSNGIVGNAVKILRKGTPELVEAVDAGEVTADAAVLLCELPSEEQQKIVGIQDKAERKGAIRQAKRDAMAAREAKSMPVLEPMDKKSIKEMLQEWSNEGCVFMALTDKGDNTRSMVFDEPFGKVVDAVMGLNLKIKTI